MKTLHCDNENMFSNAENVFSNAIDSYHFGLDERGIRQLDSWALGLLGS
jgi:hypothetical protein